MERFMKNLLSLVFILLFITTAYYPQGMTDKGSMSIEGSAFFSYKNYSNEVTEHKVSLQPGFSYFFWDNFEAGINLTFDYSHRKDESFLYIYTDQNVYERYRLTDYVDSRSYGVGLFAAKYFGKSGSKPFVFVSLLYSNVSFSPKDLYYWENPVEAITPGIGVGYIFPINKNIALTPLIQYQRLMYQSGVEERFPYAEIQDESTISVGFQIRTFL